MAESKIIDFLFECNANCDGEVDHTHIYIYIIYINRERERVLMVRDECANSKCINSACETTPATHFNLWFIPLWYSVCYLYFIAFYEFSPCNITSPNPKII